MTARKVQVAGQFLTAGSGGIARCARLTILALAAEARVKAMAVEDRDATGVGDVRTRAFAGNRAAFVAANAVAGLSSDWIVYDFAGTARAHAPLGLVGKPYAVWVHGLEVWPGNLRDDYAKAVRGARAVFVNSRHTYERLGESLPGLRTLHLCPLGTEKDVGGAEGPPSPRRERLVLFVGRNDEMIGTGADMRFAKGQDVLIEAWPEVVAQVPDAVLVFVGGGEQLQRLRGLAAASPAADSIQVMGVLSDEAVAALSQRARLFAMLSRIEGFGLVFAEAMSQGLPVLTSTDDASPELNAEGETGFSVSRDDRAAIVERIVRVLSDDDLAARLSDAARKRWAAHYSFSAFRARFLGAASDAGLIHPVRAAAPFHAGQTARHTI